MTNPQHPLAHPANAGILAYLRKVKAPSRNPLLSGVLNVHDDPQLESCDPAVVRERFDRMGTHPDCIERLWTYLDGALPERCGWVVHATPVLAHPRTGVIFGCAGGTTYSLRLPPKELATARAAGLRQTHHFPAYPDLGITASVTDLGEIGPEWVYGAWHRDEPAWCEAAFHAAAADWRTMT
jgi:hypothetical protein